VRGLDELGVFDDVLHLIRGGVAADVLFLYHFPQVRPVADAMDDVFKDPPLPVGTASSEKEPVPERLPFFGHDSSSILFDDAACAVSLTLSQV
jgi:hypothetical protein